VCLSAAVCPHYCSDPDVTRGCGRGCPLVVQYWLDLHSVHGLHCYGNITQTLVTSSRPSCVIWRHSVNVRQGLHTLLAGDWRVTGRSQNCAPYMGSGRGWLADDWPSTGCVLNITATAWTAGFHWWRSGNITRTQMLASTCLYSLCA